MRDAAYYREKAAHFRKLASGSDEHTSAALIQLAEDYEQVAGRLDRDAAPPVPSPD